MLKENELTQEDSPSPSLTHSAGETFNSAENSSDQTSSSTQGNATSESPDDIFVDVSLTDTAKTETDETNTEETNVTETEQSQINWSLYLSQALNIPYWLIVLAIISAPGFMEGADRGVGIALYGQQYDEEPTLGTLLVNIVLAYLCEVDINFEAPYEKLTETFHSIKRKCLPYNWPDLDDDKKHEWAVTLPVEKNHPALGLACVDITWKAFSGASAAYFFATALPSDISFLSDAKEWRWWEIATIALTCGVGINKLLVESLEIIKTVRQKLLKASYEYSNTFSKYASPTLAILLSLLDSVEAATQDYITNRNNFNIEKNSYPMLAYGAVCFLMMAPRFMFSYWAISSFLDKFFNAIAKKDFNLNILCTLGLSTVFAGYTMYYRRDVDRFFLRDTITEIDNAFNLNLDPNAKRLDPIFQYIVDGMYAKNMILCTEAVAEPIHSVANIALTKITATFNYIRGLACQAASEPQPDPERQPLLSNNINTAEGDVEATDTRIIPIPTRSSETTFYNSERHSPALFTPNQSKLRGSTVSSTSAPSKLYSTFLNP